MKKTNDGKMLNKLNEIVNERLWVGWVIVVLVFLVWGQTLTFGFVWDDFSTIVHNPSLGKMETFFKAFFYDFWGLHEIPQPSGYWRPIPTFFYNLGAIVWGIHPWVFHALNFLLHVGMVLMAWIMFQTMGLKGFPLWVGLSFFSLHPIHSETIGFVSALPDLLSGIFGLLALFFWQRSSISPLKRIGWGGLFFLLSLGSKESSIIFPFVFFFLAQTFWKNKISLLQQKRIFLLSILSFVIYGGIHFWVTQGIELRPLWGGTFWKHFLTLPKVFFFNLGLCFFPFRLSPVHSFPIFSGWGDFWGWFSLAGVVFLFFLLLYKGTSHSLKYSFLLFVIFLLPVSNVLPIEGLVADRYLYLPSLGIAFFLGNYFQRLNFWKTKPSWMGFGFVIFLIFWSGWAMHSSRVWKSNDSLWSKAILHSPTSSVAWNQHGVLRVEQGLLEEALQDFEKAFELNPQYREASFNRALALWKMTRKDQAINYLCKHLEQFPEDPEAWDLKSSLDADQGKIEEAIQSGQKAISFQPFHWKFHYNLGVSFFSSGQYERAGEEFSLAYQFSPQRREILVNLGASYYQMGRWREAKDVFEKLLHRWPNEMEAQRKLQNINEILTLMERSPQ